MSPEYYFAIDLAIDRKNVMDPEVKKTEEQRKEKEKKRNIAFTESLIKVVTRGISRHNRSGDPVVRATMLFDKLCLILDLFTAFTSTAVIEDYDYPEEFRMKIEETSQLLHNELNFVLDWIQNPSYSPDHPYGNSIMKEAKKSFESEVPSFSGGTEKKD